MSTIAKGEITLSPVNDAYTVSITPASCSITTDFDGLNPNLDNATGTITVKRGTKEVLFSVTKIELSSSEIIVECPSEQSAAVQFSISDIKSALLGGWVDFSIKTEDGFDYSTKVRFSFSTVREASMLDWILEWNKEYTQITGESVATPNAFIGSGKNGELSGVYIGGHMPGHKMGIYGIKGCSETAFVQGNLGASEIFHLNEDGGMIGGWNILGGGIYTSNKLGNIQFLSSGRLSFIDSETTTPFWSLNEDGSGVLAHGNITWDNEGNAVFNGRLTSASGNIGGWNIGEHSLYKGTVLIDSTVGLIGVRNQSTLATLGEPTVENFTDIIKKSGGVYMYYSGANSYGLEGWSANSVVTKSSTLVFSLGSKNMIAGWGFDSDSLYLGKKHNTAGTYTPYDDGAIITIGSEGLRGRNWYIDNDGEIDFVSGRLHFDTTGGVISGWTINPQELTAKHISLSSNPVKAGLFISNGALNDVSLNDYESVIQTDGGIALYSTDTETKLCGYTKNNKLAFQLDSSGNNLVGGWKFSETALWKGSVCSDTVGIFALKSGNMVFGTNGIRGYKWRLESDGSGALAGGNFSWTKEGTITISSGALYVTSEDGTNITLITDNKINADLIEVSKLTAKTNDVLKSTWNEDDDGSVKMYYPDGSVCLRIGHMMVDEQDTVLQCFDADGNVTWYLSLFGGQTPTEVTVPYSWSSISIVPKSSPEISKINTDKVLKGNLYYQFFYNPSHPHANPVYEPYDGMVLRSKTTDFTNTALQIPDGVYYSEIKYPGLFNIETNKQEKSYRWKYTYEGGFLVSKEKYEI